jgi:hypothetical protein
MAIRLSFIALASDFCATVWPEAPALDHLDAFNVSERCVRHPKPSVILKLYHEPRAGIHDMNRVNA